TTDTSDSEDDSDSASESDNDLPRNPSSPPPTSTPTPKQNPIFHNPDTSPDPLAANAIPNINHHLKKRKIDAFTFQAPQLDLHSQLKLWFKKTLDAQTS